MKKMTAVLLVIVLCFCVMGASAFADGTVFSYGYFYYTVADKSITITGYFGNETEVTVPSMIAGIPVNEIAPGAFDGTTVQILHLPDTVMTVPEDAGDNTRIYPDDKDSQPEQSAEPASGTGSAGTTQENVTVEDGGNSAAPEQVVVEAPPAKEDEAIPSATPEPTDSPEPTAEPTPEPTVEPTEEPTATPEATPEAEEPAAEKSGGAIGWIIGAAVLVCGGAAVIVFRKKGGKA